MNHIVTSIRQTLQYLYPPEEVRALSLMICCDMLGMDVLDIYAGKDIHLSENKQRELENILARLVKNEPIQYVRGVAEFYGLLFQVAPGVLIPRPETSELVELIVRENSQAVRVLDIGTGSGCIAISLAKSIAGAKLTAWDVSADALNIARRNGEELNAEVEFVEQDVFSAEIDESERYDVIVSNPPYVTTAEKQEMTANIIDWEPELALFVSDEDPLRFYVRIAELGRRLLTLQGRLYFEINQAYGEDIARMLEQKHYRNIRIIQDLYKKNRIVTADR